MNSKVSPFSMLVVLVKFTLMISRRLLATKLNASNSSEMLSNEQFCFGLAHKWLRTPRSDFRFEVST